MGLYFSLRTLAHRPLTCFIRLEIDSVTMSSQQEVTEIRGEEKSKGGLSYEVILAEPLTNRPPSPPVTTPSRSVVSEEDIEKKLLAAEERRKANRSVMMWMKKSQWQRRNVKK